MKKLMKLNLFPLLALALLFSVSCKDDSDEVLPADKDSDIEVIDPVAVNKEIPVSNGSIGLLIDTRPIVKSGYMPKTAYIKFDGALSSFSRELSVDKFTNLAIFEIPRDSLTVEERNLFNGGAQVEITVIDEAKKELSKTVENSLTINDSNLIFPVRTNLNKIIPPVKLNPDLHYIIQLKTGGTKSQVLDIPFENKGHVHTTFYQYLGDTLGYNNQYFYFEPVEEGNDSTYYIRAKHSNRYLGLHGSDIYQFDVANPAQLTEYFKFIITSDGEGWVNIKCFDGFPLKIRVGIVVYQKPEDTFPIPHAWSLLSRVGDAPAKFRIVAAGVKWNTTDLGTEFNNPIMSPAKMDFAYKAILKNCSPALLSESVGKQDNRISAYSMATEESFQMSSTHEASVGVSASYTASASFYGVGVETSLQATASYTYSNTMTETQTKIFETSGQTEVQVSRVRSLEVPPNSAVEVYDVLQTFSNVKIPFVQKIKLEGELNGDRLAGKEIVQQLMANQFGGVVTEIGGQHVIITIRGFSHIDKLMEARTNVEELVNGCN